MHHMLSTSVHRTIVNAFNVITGLNPFRSGHGLIEGFLLRVLPNICCAAG